MILYFFPLSFFQIFNLLFSFYSFLLASLLDASFNSFISYFTCILIFKLKAHFTLIFTFSVLLLLVVYNWFYFIISILLYLVQFRVVAAAIIVPSLSSTWRN